MGFIDPTDPSFRFIKTPAHAGVVELELSEVLDGSFLNRLKVLSPAECAECLGFDLSLENLSI